MRSKRRASNIDPKIWQEEEDADDDFEVLEVYKLPKTPVSTPQQRCRGRPPKYGNTPRQTPQNMHAAVKFSSYKSTMK